MTRTILGLTLAIAITGSALAHNGATDVVPAWPDPTTFVLDGEEDDWGWLDTDTFGIKPEKFYSTLGEHAEQGSNPNPEDFSTSVFMAWSPPPDNSFYFFSRSQDDTLRALEVKDDWWNDDSLQIAMDWDHSGGEWTTDWDEGYRMQLHPLGSRTEGGLTPPFSEGDAGPVSWGGLEPWTYVTTTILPAGAVHNATQVEYTYEIRTIPWQAYFESGPDESTVWTFEAEQVVHFTMRFDDGDRDANGEQDLWSPDYNPTWLCDTKGDECPDMILVPTDMVDPYTAWDAATGTPTAVENQTWGRIKQHISN
jgi:hypothetical protein